MENSGRYSEDTVATQSQDHARLRADIQRFHATLERQTYFELLGVTPHASADELKNAYRSLARKYHADAYQGSDLGIDQGKLNEIFQAIREAYETLTDPQRREEYLVFLQRKSRGMATDVGAIFRAEELVDQALAEMKRKQWDGAIQTLDAARKLNPDDPLYDVHRAWAVYSKRPTDPVNAERALSQLAASVKRQQSLPLAYQYMGQIYFNLARPDDAKRWYRRCLEWEPDNVVAQRGIRLANSRAQKKEAGLSGLLARFLKKR